MAEHLRGMLAREKDVELSGVQSQAEAGISQATTEKPDVLLVDALLQGKVTGADVAKRVRTASPGTRIVMVTVPQRPVDPRPELGIDAVFVLPGGANELAAALGGSKDTKREGGGEVIAVYSPKGGTGKTTIAVNLACVLRRNGASVALFDGVMQFGAVRHLLPVPPATKSIVDLPAGQGMRPSLPDALWEGPGGIDVLLAPPRPEEADLVAASELTNAIALNASLFNTARIFGPALAGVLIAAFGSGWCFAINTLSFLAVLGGLLAMRVSELFPLLDRRRPTMWRGTREGFVYALHNRTVLVTLVMTAVFSAVGFNFNILLPLLAKNTLEAGPRTFGIISACFGAGALVGALLAAAVSRTTWRVMLLGSAGFGICELLIAPVRSTLLVGALLFICGIFFTSYTANSNSAIQLASPDHIRGRVLGLYYYAWNGLAPLGALLVGWMCDRGGTELAFAVGGVSGLTMTVLGALAIKPPKRFTPRRVQAEPAEQIAA